MLDPSAGGKMAKAGLLPLTASQQAKAVGLKSLAQVTELTGVSAQTLINWRKNKPELFAVVLLGCVSSNSQRAGRE